MTFAIPQSDHKGRLGGTSMRSLLVDERTTRKGQQDRVFQKARERTP